MPKPEAQTIEYKSSWQDEYFEWICGYANVKGGDLYIGVNDDGYVVGLDDTRYLLDVLPNQIVDHMGIVVEIEHEMEEYRGQNIKYKIIPDDIAQKPDNLYVRGILTEKALRDIEEAPDETRNVSSDVRTLFEAAPGFVKQLRRSADYRANVRKNLEKYSQDNPVHENAEGVLDYIRITVPVFPYGISYRGHYYTRSGGTTRELKGIALSQFLMERVGKHWDGIPIPNVKVSDLDPAAIQAYRKKAVDNGRHTEAEVNVPDEQIISDLKLIEEESGELKRAAIMLFHPDPERYVTGAYVKIAFFAPEGAYGANKSDDIIYHDEVPGPLMTLADKVVDMMYSKYMKALSSYKGLQRIETFMTPREAFREVILNAINHKIYESGNPIQISVYEDRIVVFNQGNWPEDIELKDIYTKKHSSYPHNPNLTRPFFESGEIEAYGSGFGKIKIECDKHNAPYPELSITPNGVTVEIKASELYMKLLRYGRYWDTYPDNKEESILVTEKGEVITTESGEAIAIETEVDPETLISIGRMMDILSRELSDPEKIIYEPIAGFLKTHEIIKNADVMRITGKKSSSTNRYLNRLVELQILDPEGENKGRFYRRRG